MEIYSFCVYVPLEWNCYMYLVFLRGVSVVLYGILSRKLKLVSSNLRFWNYFWLFIK